MRLIYLLATLTALLGLACQIGRALSTVNEVTQLVDDKPTLLQVGLAPNSLLLDDKPTIPSESGPSTIHGSPTKKHTLHKRVIPYDSYFTEYDYMYQTNDNYMYQTKNREGNHIVGGSGGGAGEYWGCDDGETMSMIEAWAGQNALIGLKITFTNGKVWSVGTPWSPGTAHQFYKFQRGEYLTKLSIWPNRNQDRVAVIRFGTNLGKEDGWLSTGHPNPGPEHKFRVYSGILCGMSGRFGSEVDAISFAFLKDVESVELHSVQYSDSDNGPSHSVRIIEESMEERNDEGKEETFEFYRQIEHTESVTWKNTDPGRTTFGSNIGAKTLDDWTVIGKPPTVDFTAESGWSHAFKDSKERIGAGTTTKRENIEFPFTAPPHSHVRATAIIVEDTLNLRFTGLWTVTFTDGTSRTFKFNGIYEGISYRQAFTMVAPIHDSTPKPYTITWNKYNPKNYPKGVHGFVHGYDKTGESFYIARAKGADGKMYPGKFGPHDGVCIYTDHSKMYAEKDFQILEVDPDILLWIPVAGELKKGPCPKGLVLLPGGNDGNGKSYYIARTRVGGGLNLGYSAITWGEMEYGDYDHKTHTGKVRHTKNYEVLCVPAGFDFSDEY